MSKREWKMSATCMSCLKACPTRFRLSYVEGLRPAEDTEALRVGTHWHKLLEIATAPGDDDPLERAVAWLNEKYATVPPNKDATERAVERTILANALAGYLWYYQNDGIKTIAREIKFNLPLRNPETGRALPNVRRVGKIDRIVEQRDRLLVGEYKSTSKSINSDSSYWERLALDTQISCYCAAAREMRPTWRATAGDGRPIAGVLYDVWHKPRIRPKKLTQAESKAFVESGEYCGRQFEVVHYHKGGEPLSCVVGSIRVDECHPEIRPGKKEGTFTIRETPEMFGARLLADITGQKDVYPEAHGPEYYFARREIARTDAQIERHLGETYHLYKVAREMEKTGWWWTNEAQCEATFRCLYTPICYHGVDVFDGKTTPPGFRRIFNSDIPTEEA